MSGGTYGGDMSHLHRQGTTVAQMEEEGHALARNVASDVDTVKADQSDGLGAGRLFMAAVDEYRDKVLRKGNQLANAIGRLGTNVAEGANTTQQTQNETTTLQNGSGNPINNVTQASAPISSGGGGGGATGQAATLQPAPQLQAEIAPMGPQYEAEIVPLGDPQIESSIEAAEWVEAPEFESSIEAAPWVEAPEFESSIEAAPWVETPEFESSIEAAPWVEAPSDAEIAPIGQEQWVDSIEGGLVAEPGLVEPGLPVAEPAPFEPDLPVAEPAPFEPDLPVAEPAPVDPEPPVAEPAPVDDTSTAPVVPAEPGADAGNGEGEGWAPEDPPVAAGQSSASVDYVMDANGNWVKHPTMT